MGSPLAPILANLFLSFHEETWINSFDISRLLLYKCYVDETFCVFDNEEVLCHFLILLILSIRTLTFEKQTDGKLSFLDILINNSSSCCVFSVFHKTTYTG